MGTVNVTEERVELTVVDKGKLALKEAQQDWKALRSSIDTVKNALAAVGTAVGAGAMVSLAHDILKANAALDDFSTSTGASVENLSALRRVATVGGRDFDLVTDSMGKMIKGLKGADEHGQNAGHALEFLGIKAKNADGTFRDQAQVMIEIANALAKYEDSGNKTALVQDLYGKGAQRLLPFLKDLAKETDLHATVTARQAAQAKEAEENLNRLNAVMAEGRRELVIQYTPAIIEFTEKLLAASKASGGLIGGFATFARGAGTGDIVARMKEIDGALAAIAKGRDEPRTFQFGTGASETLLKQEREYLKFVQRQQALAGSGPGDFDSRDLRMRQPAMALGYQSLDKRKLPKGLSAYDQEVLALQQNAAKQDSGDSEFMKTSLAVKAGKYNTIDEVTGKVRTLTDAEKQYLLQLAAAADTEKSYKDLRDEKLKGDVKVIETMDAETAKRRERSAVILNSLSSETERENKEYEIRRSNLAEYLASTEGQRANGEALRETLEMQHQQRLLDIEKNKNAAQRSMEIQTWQLAGQLLQQFAGKSKAAALAVLAINKGLAVAQVIVNTQAAVARGYAELGVYAGTANAAYMEGLMAVQIGLIAATGLIEASNVGSGGASPGSPANPVNTTGGGAGAGPTAPAQQAPAAPQTTIIQFSGSTSDESLIRRFVEMLNQNSRDGGQIVVT